MKKSKYIGIVINNIEIIDAKYTRGETTYFICKCQNCKNVFMKSLTPIKNKTLKCKCMNVTKTHKRLRNIYKGMKHRCYNIKCDSYKNYGGRGIKICDEWLNDFETFYDWAITNGYEDNLSIDRIDVNGDYEPLNCKWATAKEQANNRTNNHYVIYRGEHYTISQLALIFKLDRNLLNKRIRRGWNIEDAVRGGD